MKAQTGISILRATLLLLFVELVLLAEAYRNIRHISRPIEPRKKERKTYIRQSTIGLEGVRVQEHLPWRACAERQEGRRIEEKATENKKKSVNDKHRIRIYREKGRTSLFSYFSLLPPDLFPYTHATRGT